MAKQKSADGMVKVRILTDFALGKANTVTEIPAAEVEALAGVVDATPEAVAYAESLIEE